MTNKEIFEQVIKIAIENGYVNDFDGPLIDLATKIRVNTHSFEVRLYDEYADRKINFIMLVTSKEFIEAIAKSIENEDNFGWNALKYETLEDYITCKQALAIRDNTLVDFYRGILNIKD